MRPTAGFTLLEILVTLCVLALLSLAISGGLHLGAGSLARARNVAASAADIRQAEFLLRQIVAGATPAFAAADPSDRRIAFAGTPTELDLITRLPAALGAPVPIAARIFADAETRTLRMAWRLDLPASDGGTLPEQTATLARHIAALRLAYAGKGWQTLWSGQTRLPEAVRIALDADGTQSIVWPTLEISPQANATSACTYDPSDLTCARVR